MSKCTLVDDWPPEGNAILLALALTLGATIPDAMQGAEMLHRYAHYFRDLTTAGDPSTKMLDEFAELAKKIGTENALAVMFDRAASDPNTTRSEKTAERGMTVDYNDIPPVMRDAIDRIKRSLGVPADIETVVTLVDAITKE